MVAPESGKPAFAYVRQIGCCYQVIAAYSELVGLNKGWRTSLS